MKPCRYHPLEASHFICHQCHYHACQQCAEENDQYTGEHTCFLCKAELEHLGSAQAAEPFWRQLKRFFHYPLATEAITALVIGSVISLLGLFIPLVSLLATAFIYKYCFCCLEETALGNLKPPQVNKASSGGFSLLLQIAGILLVNLGAVFLAAQFLGGTIALVVGIFAVIALPAAFMILAIDKDLGQAINPIRQWRLMGTIGSSYLILLLLIFIMVSSVGALNYAISDNFANVGQFLSILVSNYYTIVIFHLLGYTLYQYQDQLGLVSQEQSDFSQIRTNKERCKAHASMLLKDGDFRDACNCYHDYLRKHPRDTEMADRLFNLLIALKYQEGLELYADQYLQLLFNTDQLFKVSSCYKQLRLINKDYQPKWPNLSHLLAEQLYQLGDFNNAARLLKNFHKREQDKKAVAEAYQLMVKVLTEIPNTEKQQQQYLSFIGKLEAKA